MSELLEAAKAAKHDLGKYVAFEARWLPPEASRTDRLRALQADVLHTRRSAQASEGAVDLWGRLRPGLAALGDDPDLAAVDAAVAALAAHGPGLADGSLDGEALADCAAQARRIADHLAALHRRLRQES